MAYLNCINESDILGVAGSSFNSIYVKTNVLVGNCDELEYGGTERVNGIEECNTLDECLFGGYTEYFRKRNLMKVYVMDGIYMLLKFVWEQCTTVEKFMYVMSN
mgnify:CR=1 FL=1